jgi:hypothetical protein
LRQSLPAHTTDSWVRGFPLPSPVFIHVILQRRGNWRRRAAARPAPFIHRRITQVHTGHFGFIPQTSDSWTAVLSTPVLVLTAHKDAETHCALCRTQDDLSARRLGPGFAKPGRRRCATQINIVINIVYRDRHAQTQARLARKYCTTHHSLSDVRLAAFPLFRSAALPSQPAPYGRGAMMIHACCA